MNEPIRLSFEYSEEEWTSAVRFYQNWKLRTKSDVIVALAMLLFGGVAWWQLGYELVWLFLIGASVLMLALMALAIWILPRVWFRQEAKYQDEYHLEFGEDEISFKTRRIDSRIQWTLYHSVLESPQFFILLYGKRALTILPKRAFANLEEEDRFRELAYRKVPTARR